MTTMALENIQKLKIQELNKEKARRQDNKQHCHKVLESLMIVQLIVLSGN